MIARLRYLTIGVCVAVGLVAPGKAVAQNDDATLALAELLGPGAAGWKLTRAPATGVVSNPDGRTGLSPGQGGSIILQSSADSGPGIEHLLEVRFLSTKTSSGTVDIRMGRDDAAPDRKPLAFFLSVSNEASLRYSFSNQLVETPVHGVINGEYELLGLKKRQLNWPEDYRKRVEWAYAGLETVTERSFALRVTSRSDRAQVFLDDGLIAEWLVGDGVVNGSVEIELRGEVLLGSLQTREVDLNSLYFPVPLDHHVNASAINGARVARESLATTDGAARVGGVPFLLARPNAAGNDHVDVGQSWFEHANLAGYLQNFNGPFGGRWKSFTTANPARLQFAVPKQPYCRLHVLAASDDQTDSLPAFSAQFYLPDSGFPVSAEAPVPAFTADATSVERLPVELTDGTDGALHLVTFELDIDQIAGLSKLESLSVQTRYTNGRTMLGLELTKSVQLFRSYPDPISYSFHGAGLPSAVHVYAMTLERPRIEVAFEPDKLAHIWIAPESPSYTVTLTNYADAARTVSLLLQTTSYDGEEATEQKETRTVMPGKTITVPFSLSLERYGSHTVELTLADGDQTWTAGRRLAYLHADTRTRGGWERGKGALWGYWGYASGHYGVPREKELRIMAQAGCETMSFVTFGETTPEVQAIGREFKMKTLPGFEGFDKWLLGQFGHNLKGGMAPAEAEAILLKELKARRRSPSDLDEARYIGFFPEPNIGHITHGNLPVYYGEPEYVLSDEEQKNLDNLRDAFLRGVKMVKEHWPEVEIMMPWGDPMFLPPFLRQDPKLADLIDAQGIDEPLFERLPEAQIGQATGHRKWQLRQEWKKIGKEPEFIFVEGNFIPATPGGVTVAEQADYVMRHLLHFLAYEMYNLPAGVTGVSSANWYGEEHYGTGYLVDRRPYLSPNPAYATFATLTRHLNRKNFVRYLPTGSLSVFCLQFEHHETGELTHVMWTVRGKRPVSLNVGRGGKPTVYDQMDNRVRTTRQGAEVRFTVGSSPVFVEGLADAPKVGLGAPDHADSVPAEVATKLTNFGDGNWSISEARDETYEHNHPHQMARFQGKMRVKKTPAPQEQGGRALSIHLQKQDKERVTMPWYTTLIPENPIVVPGQASHLGLWVYGHSDWGRVIYSLRDAQGERWVSIGTKGQWNCDDIHGWSAFNFDGWRYLRFEMPAHAPYDSFREVGTTWWGHFEKGDGIVDLPLEIEKVIVERRTHVMYVNEPVEAKDKDVLFGDLFAEYASAADQGDEAVRLSRLRMPLPADPPALQNPIAEMIESGTGAPMQIRGTELPMHGPDGTKCHVNFDLVEGATGYDVWASPYADGRGAMCLRSGLTESRQLVDGFRPDTDFYLFIVYNDKDGKPSKPSAPFKIRLQDLFLQK